MKNWSSAAVSDLVVFNSEYHRTVFFDEVYRFLNSFPENKHAGFLNDVRSRSIVLPVGINVEPLVGRPVVRSTPPLIVWNQRWEHDKGPGELKEIVSKLVATDVDFTIAMCGEVFVSVPPMFEKITSMLKDRLIHQGYAERGLYEALLLRADAVLSTAHQEFFGIGVVEAIAAGAHPVLADRLVYPERMSALGFDPGETLYQSTDCAAELVVSRLGSEPSEDRRAATMQYDWSAVAPAYDAALETTVTR
jgi:glycosyltransferase involved in cell wall biosynthesis